MTTDEAVEKNDQNLRGMLMNLQVDIQSLLSVDYDQVQWQVVCEAASLADTINRIIHPEPREIE